MPDADRAFDSSYDHIPGVPLPRRMAGTPEEAEFLRSGGQAFVVREYASDTSGPAVTHPEIGTPIPEAYEVFNELTTTYYSPLNVHVDVNDLIQDHGLEKALSILGDLKDLFA